MAPEIFGKDPFAGPGGLVLAHCAEAKFLPRRFGALDNERRRIGVELIGVRPAPAVRGLLEDEGKGVVELLMRAEPNELILAGIYGRLKMLCEFNARPRI